MVKTTVYLEADTVLSLRQLAESQGRSQAELIRDALETYTRHGKRPRLRNIGKYDSGETNISEKAEDILREASKKGKWH